MKNKLVKTNMTKFDYRARRLGIVGVILLGVSLTVALPVATSLSNINKQLTQDITIIQMENGNDETVHQYNVESK